MSSVLCNYLKKKMLMMTWIIEDVTESNLPGNLKQQVIENQLAKWEAFDEVRNFILDNYMEVDNEEDTNRIEH